MSTTQKKHLEKPSSQQKLYPTLSENFAYIQTHLHHTSDLCIHEMCIHGIHIAIFYLETTADYERIQKVILGPFSTTTQLDTTLTTMKVQQTDDLNKAVEMLLKGDCIIYVEGYEELYLSHTATSFHRTPEEPQNEKVVRGAHEGFVEDLQSNLSLVRKKIINRQLKMKYFTIGKKTQTKMALVYIDTLVNPTLLQKIEQTLLSISSDIISGSGHLEAFLESQPFSPFPQILYTARPDRVMAHVTEGKVAVILDGSPDILIMPITFLAFFQTPDDFNSRIFVASFIRFMRMISFFIAITLPAMYIAIISYHFEIIPNDIIVLVKSSVEGIPFSPLVEAVIMALTIELIREAGIRLPTPIGQTIGIIGGLIIGDAVVRAGFVSNTMVIVIAVTAIASFTIPSYEMSAAIRLLMFPLMLAATCLGVVGIVFGMMFIFAHLCKLESLGEPYFMPFAPLHITELKDSFIRFPIWLIDRFSKKQHVCKKNKYQ